MLSYQSSILRRTLPITTFNRLRLAFEQMAQSIPEETLLLTEDLLEGVDIPSGIPPRFAVLVSERFSALLVGSAVEVEVLGWQATPTGTKYQVGLTFESKAIAQFLSWLNPLLKQTAIAKSTLKQTSHILKPNDPSLQSEFTLCLLEIIAQEDPESIETEYSYPAVCQPVQDALRQQTEQEGLLNQVTAQIRQTIELPVILQTAIEEVRSFLQADRLVIFQFNSQTSSTPSLPDSSILLNGCITYEARANNSIPSVLNLVESQRCFINLPNYRKKYSKGLSVAVEDVETAYAKSDCLLELMRRATVRAKLFVPIVIGEQLWGLLIAHQCFERRYWQESEKTFLQQIAEHLAIAIHQSQLYAELQQQKYTLEQRVIERTQELHDALVAAQSANRTKTEFLATMSHELRTPLTCVIGLSSTLLRWSFGQLTQRQRDYLQTIHDNGEHLLELINDILDLSQVEAGKTVLSISEFSLSQLTHQCLQSFKDKAIKRGVELSSDLRIHPRRDRLRADPRRVKQILLNLLSNAIKFTPENGKVILRIWQEQNTAVFQVEDTGIGIPEHQKHLLFQKFQQLDTSYHRQYEGIGLGLALTKQLVELHNGRIEVESTPGEGSIFTVWLPSQPLSSIPTVESITPDLPSGRIAVIADQEESATLICDILTAAGCQVVWIVEGSAAVKQMEILQPSIAIVDIYLSGMSGYEVIRQLRNSPATKGLKVLALIEGETPDDLKTILVEGADDYLVKPIQPEELLRQVVALIAADVPATCSIG
jgi:two-component system, sensor histidine kinase and response regulator